MSQPVTREDSLVILNAALSIADDTVRSDVESYALIVESDQTGFVYDLTQANCSPGDEPEANAEAIRIAQRAARYIRARGEHTWPWRMVQVGDNPDLVRFEDEAEGH